MTFSLDLIGNASTLVPIQRSALSGRDDLAKLASTPVRLMADKMNLENENSKGVKWNDNYKAAHD